MASISHRKHRGARKRTTNTHDPDKSTRHFEAALERAERDLTAAAESLSSQKPTAKMVERQVDLLLSSAYWLGRAASEESYARTVRPEAKARLRELEESYRTWGATLRQHALPKIQRAS